MSDAAHDSTVAFPERRERLEVLEKRDEFCARHIGPDAEQIAAMLNETGAPSLATLIEETIPEGMRSEQLPELDLPQTERDVLSALRAMGERNRVVVSMLGMGYYGTITPSVIKRSLLENPAWYTAYTPYQAEISQGRLEALLAFQQMVIDLTGMDLANASLLDEATAAAEAMTMSKRLAKTQSNTFLVAHDCHPQTIAVVQTRAAPLGIEVRVGEPGAALESADAFGVLLQYPGSSGMLHDPRPVIAAAHAAGALVTIASDLLALTLLKPPGEMDADVVVGSAQRFGVAMGYGGPHAAFFATRDSFKRSTPGRLIGVSVDARGRPALRMALQTREQHIRREKATSNICTAQVLLAIIAACYAIYHGPAGLVRIAKRTHRMARIFATGLQRLGYENRTRAYFDTLTVATPSMAQRIAARALEAGINLRVVDDNQLGIAFDETSRRSDLEILWRVFAGKSNAKLDVDELDGNIADAIPKELRRESAFLTHGTFNSYHSETEMLRYLRRLASRDIALDRAMIPLGSCTMKLNASTEMQALSSREFTALHPFAPLDQTQGYQQLFDELETQLCRITGFDAFSLQPNAGSQGEYAGLLVIRKFHEHNGAAQRNICLIPASAHGTNPASASLAGLEVVVVACNDRGDVDLQDLETKAHEHKDRLAALMITYPSTHGVFEEGIADMCATVHACGGQIYMDGANMNAMVGLCKPAEFGVDVSHLNLHKTFCIPHGGGGPGMGPIGVRSHLAPYLPDHPVVHGVNPAAGDKSTIGAIAGAPWGSASLLTISWSYIAMMGAAGLRLASEVAILNANYIAARLSAYYPILYKGRHGRVAHECIIDLRPMKAACGITVDDVAKRLIDYGFHAPTMSFPVADTLMIEPTESETKRELDRFCAAMIAIREEIADVERGAFSAEQSPMRNAPHTQDLLIDDEWLLPYSKERAFFPLSELRFDKYWPPISRIDNLHGDRQLVCTLPPVDTYADE